MTRVLKDTDIIVELLRTLPDAREALSRGDIVNDKGDKSKLLAFPPTYHEGSYRQLEDALVRMRKRGKQEALGGVSVATLYWHLNARYFRSVRRTVDQWESRAGKNGKKARVKVRVVVYVEDRDYAIIPEKRRVLCHGLGVRWLAQEFRRTSCVPFLPKEIHDLVAA